MVISYFEKFWSVVIIGRLYQKRQLQNPFDTDGTEAVPPRNAHSDELPSLPPATMRFWTLTESAELPISLNWVPAIYHLPPSTGMVV